MNKEELLNFIHEAHHHTYAAPEEIKIKYKTTSFQSKHKDYAYKKGKFRYRDSYAGWRWPPGKETVFYDEEPVWCMSYQGKSLDNLSNEFIEGVYSFLKKALMQSSQEMPFRGPIKYSKGDFQYTFKIKGDYSYFIGRESIRYKKKEVFFQDIMGTLIKE